MDDDPPEGASLEAPVKFFNRAKGFGFVTLPGGQDVFFHVSSLAPLGLNAVDQGDVLVCEIGEVPRGRQVTRIIRVKHAAVPLPQAQRGPRRGPADRLRREGGFADRPPRREFGERPRREAGGERPRREFGPRSAADGPSEIVAGTVKFFDVRKGFGFIVPESGADVFVPLRALGALAPESLTPGRRVRATVVTGPKGRQALSVEML